MDLYNEFNNKFFKNKNTLEEAIKKLKLIQARRNN